MLIGTLRLMLGDYPKGTEMQNCVRSRRVAQRAAIAGVMWLSGCSETSTQYATQPGEATAPTEPATVPRRNSTTYDSFNSRAPGYLRYTTTEPNGAYGGGLSRVAIPINLSEPTLLHARASGLIARIRSTAIYVHGTQAGTSTWPLDPNGYAGPSFQCVGNLVVPFVTAGGANSGGMFCAPNGTNLVDAVARSPIDTSFVANGQGFVERRNSIDKMHQLCGSPNQPPCFFYSGKQVLELVPGRQHLQVTTPGGYEGDPITFTATAGSFSLVVRQWVWVPDDSLAAPPTVACLGTAAVCTTTVNSAGHMFVRARVNTSPWRVEQASVRVDPLPIRLVARINRRFVGGGDTVTVTLSSEPAGKVITSPHLAGGTASLSTATCTSSPSACRAAVQGSGSIVVHALVSGLPRTASAQVDTIPCATGDSTLDNPVMRDMLRNLERIGNKTSPPKEMAGYIFRDSLGIERWVIDSLNPANDCSTSGFRSNLLPSGQVLVSGAHLHPGAPKDPVLCPPAGRRYAAGPLRGLPSPADWHISEQHGVPVVVIDRQSLARYGASTLSDSVRVRQLDGRLTWFRIPNATEFASSYRQVSRNPPGCTRP